jgi:predicted RNA-binding protein with PIN domain
VGFDGYRVKGSRGSQEKLGDVQVVYTGENETADSYIEALAARIGGNYAVRVVSSDALVQLSSFRSGVLRMSARELREEVELARKEMKNILGNRFQSDE